MTNHVLDTDTLSLYQQGHPSVVANVASHSPCGITVISVEEQFLGRLTQIRRAQRADQIERAYENLARVSASVASFSIFNYTQNAIARFQHLKSLKITIGANDLRIAVITLELGATIVTRNLRDFQRVPSLKIVDWCV